MLLISSSSYPCPRLPFVFWMSKVSLKIWSLGYITFYIINGYSSPFVQTHFWRNLLTESNFDLLLFKPRHLKRHNRVQTRLHHHKNQWFTGGSYFKRPENEEFVWEHVYPFPNPYWHTSMSYWVAKPETNVVFRMCCSRTEIFLCVFFFLIWMFTRNVLFRKRKDWI